MTRTALPRATTRRLVAILATLLLLTVSACAADSARDKTTLRIAYNAKPPTIDPLMSTATATQVMMRNVYEPLVTNDKSGRVMPMIAQRWEVSPDFTTYTFTIRPGLHFHDGSPVTTADVAASVERWTKITSTGKSFFKEAKIRAVDDARVEVRTVKPLFTGLQLLADPGQLMAVMPKRVIDAAGPSGVREHVGTGPYKVAEFNADRFLRLEGNRAYTPIDLPADGLSGRREVNFEQMVFTFVSDPSTRLSGLQTGEFDVINAIPPDNANFVKSDSNLDLQVNPNGFNAAIFNKKAGLMADVRMRRAVLAAMDPKDIQTAAFAQPEYYTLNGSLMMPHQAPWFSNKGVDQVYNVRDPARARSLLQEAGYQGQPIRILTSREYDDHYNGAVVLREQLRNAGMNAELGVYDWPTVLQRRTDANAYEIFITGFSEVVLPVQFVFLTASWPGWSNDPASVKAMERMGAAKNEAEAARAAEDLQVATNEYAPIAKYGDKTNLTALRSNLKGYDWQTGDIFWHVRKE